ncbi:MAG: amidohydrolase family protein [Planctomycetota bacterium]
MLRRFRSRRRRPGRGGRGHDHPEREDSHRRQGVLGRRGALTREQALRLYTINNAYLHHEEADKGSLETGKLADLIVIDRDYLTCPLKGLSQTRVLMTMVGGKVVHEEK